MDRAAVAAGENPSVALDTGRGSLGALQRSPRVEDRDRRAVEADFGSCRGLVYLVADGDETPVAREPLPVEVEDGLHLVDERLRRVALGQLSSHLRPRTSLRRIAVSQSSGSTGDHWRHAGIAEVLPRSTSKLRTVASPSSTATGRPARRSWSRGRGEGRG